MTFCFYAGLNPNLLKPFEKKSLNKFETGLVKEAIDYLIHSRDRLAQMVERSLCKFLSPREPRSIQRRFFQICGFLSTK